MRQMGPSPGPAARVGLRRRLFAKINLFARPVPVSSRGQDTWFSATGPGFESPYRYQTKLEVGSKKFEVRGVVL
jgi:hypothetical protein